jgi:hypothetical protein
MTATVALAGSWINGASEVTSGGRHAVINPANQETVAELTLGTPADVDRAVTGARLALRERATTPAQRCTVLTRLIAPRTPRDQHRLRLDQQPHPDHQRTPTRSGASGFGKDISTYSLDEHLAIKHVMSDITGTAENPGTEQTSPTQSDLIPAPPAAALRCTPRLRRTPIMSGFSELTRKA